MDLSPDEVAAFLKRGQACIEKYKGVKFLSAEIYDRMIIGSIFLGLGKSEILPPRTLEQYMMDWEAAEYRLVCFQAGRQLPEQNYTPEEIKDLEDIVVACKKICGFSPEITYASFKEEFIKKEEKKKTKDRLDAGEFLSIDRFNRHICKMKNIPVG